MLLIVEKRTIIELVSMIGGRDCWEGYEVTLEEAWNNR